MHTCVHGFFLFCLLVYWLWSRNCTYLELSEVGTGNRNTIPLSNIKDVCLLNPWHPSEYPKLMCKDANDKQQGDTDEIIIDNSEHRAYGNHCKDFRSINSFDPQWPYISWMHCFPNSYYLTTNDFSLFYKMLPTDVKFSTNLQCFRLCSWHSI